MKAFFSLQGRVLSERPRQHKLALGSFQFPGGCFHAREDPTPSTPRCHALVDAAILGDYSMTKAIFLGIVPPRGPIRSSRPFVLSKILNFNKGLMQTLPAGNTDISLSILSLFEEIPMISLLPPRCRHNSNSHFLLQLRGRPVT